MTDDAMFSRVLVDFERGAFDRESGRFPMTLATDGEASDGHILNIAGAQVPERLPLLLSHENHPTAIMGSIVEADSTSGRKLRAVGVLNMTDDGTWLAETRQGIATLVETGDLRGVSIRWSGLKEKRRTELAPDHPAYVGPDERDMGKRYGLYFEKWRALEGSLVAIGADPKALIGRAEACVRDESRSFFRELAQRVEAERAEPVVEKFVEYHGVLIPEAVRDAIVEEARELVRTSASASADAITDLVAEMISAAAVAQAGERVAPATTPDPDPAKPAAPSGPPRVADIPADVLVRSISQAVTTAVDRAVRKATGRVS